MKMSRFAPMFVAFASVAAVALARPASAQLRLTGLTLYNSAADGTFNGGFWNTVGPDGAFNVYLFTGTTATPTFLNSGNTNATLTPNVLLNSGTNTINFAAATSPSEFFGLNFYFNDANTTNRITAVVRNTANGGGFAQVASGIATYGLPSSGNVPSANSLSFTVGEQTVTLTGLTINNTNNSGADLVGAVNNAPDGGNDNVGTMTLTVSNVAAPEPGALALVGLGLLPVANVVARRRAR
jgi:hypothetical protein